MSDTSVSKFKKLAVLMKASANHPENALKTVKYLGKYGYVGLREKLYQEWILEDESVPLMHEPPGSTSGTLKFSILVPLNARSQDFLERTLESIVRQTYGNWEVCIVGDDSVDQARFDDIKELNGVTSCFIQEQSAAAVMNRAFANSSGAYCVVLPSGDELSADALYEIFLRASNAQAEIIYYDQDEIDENGARLSSLKKPEYSYDLLLSQMYFGRSFAFKRNVFDKVGGFRSEYDKSEDYDFVLRATEHCSVLEHISKALCYQRESALLGGVDPCAQDAGRRAVQDHLTRVYGETYARVNDSPFDLVYDVRYSLNTEPRVSIIIPTKDHVEDLRTAIDSIVGRTEYDNFEIIILDNRSEEADTFSYFEELENGPLDVVVEPANYDFNWSKLNNQGTMRATGDVFVYLNNDIVVRSPDWLRRLVENCTRDDIGVVGALLLYPDETIQHAGVVVGMGGWADHVYKGANPRHQGSPFISPMVSREVTAVTGACMALSRHVYEKIGGFNENFVVCGSDVELCLRARDYDLRNLYLPAVCLIHYESKSRDVSKVPEIDYKLSKIAYRRYLEAGDPYYNENLDYRKCIPTVLSRRERLRRVSSERRVADVPEITPIRFRRAGSSRLRVNLLIPSINQEDIYGGIATALKFYERLVDELGADARIIVTDGEPRITEAAERFDGYRFVSMDETSDAHRQIVSAVSRLGHDLPITKGDWFICTTWWSAYCMQEASGESAGSSVAPSHPLLYFVQDFEPGFYAWSTRYLLAESTYKSNIPTIAIFNSSELRNFFTKEGYSFEREYFFEPFLNGALRKNLAALNGEVGKRRQILVYGRPGVERNAFELVVETLRQWVEFQNDSGLWEIVSAGEKHAPIYLGKGKYLISVGKLSIDEYAQLLAESYAGISFMVSPHPSYPPLEMAAFGVRVITNSYATKNLSDFGDCVVSLDCAIPSIAARTLKEICDDYAGTAACAQVDVEYLNDRDAFHFVSEIKELIEASL